MRNWSPKVFRNSNATPSPPRLDSSIILKVEGRFSTMAMNGNCAVMRIRFRREPYSQGGLSTQNRTKSAFNGFVFIHPDGFNKQCRNSHNGFRIWG
jgi:hypothetical protein